MAMNYENTDLTGVSFSRDMPIPEHERRRNDRQISIYRVATIRTGGFHGLCLIRNISAGGLMGTVDRMLPVSASARIEISSGNPINGQIVWTKDLLIGVQFDQAIDVMQILNAHSEGVAGRTRRMRLNITSAARILVGGISRDVQLVDISQGGAKIEADYLRPGDQVVIAINGLDACRGVICWSDGGRAGISFNAPIAFHQLAGWASRQESLEKHQ
jgi:hypothetical protein